MVRLSKLRATTIPLGAGANAGAQKPSLCTGCKWPGNLGSDRLADPFSWSAEMASCVLHQLRIGGNSALQDENVSATSVRLAHYPVGQ